MAETFLVVALVAIVQTAILIANYESGVHQLNRRARALEQLVEHYRATAPTMEEMDASFQPKAKPESEVGGW